MDDNTSNHKLQKLHFIYRIILGISIILAAICLIAGCITIYRMGSKPFSRETVADMFSKISVPVFLCLFLTAAGFLLDLLLPDPCRDVTKRFPPYAWVLKSLYGKKDLNAADAQTQNKLSALRRSRTIHAVIRTVLLCAASVLFLIYACSQKHYDSSDINGSIIKAMYVLLPCLLVSFSCSVFTLYRNEHAFKQELELLKTLPPAREKTGSDHSAGSAADSGRKKISAAAAIRWTVLACGVFLLIYGAASGGIVNVLTKAANICTECIGLG